MRKQLVASAIMLSTCGIANAENLYWKVIDGNGKLLANVQAGGVDLVPGLQTQMQDSYPGIKLLIDKCRQATLVEAMDPVYGKSWQCGTIVYRGMVVVPPAPAVAVVKFPPLNDLWHYFGKWSTNDVYFINEPHQAGQSLFIWMEDYDVWALSEAVAKRLGVEVIPIDIDNYPQAVRRAAEEIVRADPEKIGVDHLVTGRAQKTLYEIDCGSVRMRSIQDIDANRRVEDMPGNLDARWFKPGYPDVRRELIKLECGK